MPRNSTQTLLPAIAAMLAFGFAAPAGLHAVEFGDHASSTLTTKAWQAMGTPADALAYVNKCIELYEGEALKMQVALTAAGGRKPDEGKEATSARWALNDVGTCLLIKGDLLLKQGDKAGAKEAYRKLAKNLADAQCWDTKGWFWSPAATAKQKLVELELDAP